MKISDNSGQLDIEQLFPFKLDDFQQQAIAALEARKSVVVCAPTGSGKTLIGEYAIHAALARGRRVFYTTPLKALSNQKLRDFRHEFGTEKVGIVTGDVSINREAPILVMTTEIFRNMLYGTPIGQIGTSLTGVETVVLDECHYMNDRQRGTVWEESIVYCPREIQLVALSATIANSEQLTDWINQVHGPTELIYSDFRPVPLEYHFCNQKGVFPLLNNNKTKMNPLLGKQKRRSPGKSPSEKNKEMVPALTTVLSQLQQRQMLPAIYFIFSRRGCDKAVEEASNLSLLNPAEAERLRQHLDKFLTRYPEVARTNQVELLYRGIAAHHAGILPAWKGLVEELFQQGSIKVVFATETLAAGINMPARTTVISSLSKRTDRGHRLLNPSEFLQMAGRAGRRGMDARGYLVTVQTRFEGAKEAAYLATAGADPSISQFTPSYGMVLNLLQTHTLLEARELVERSFGQYLANLALKPQQQAIAGMARQLTQVESYIASYGDLETLGEQSASYEKLRQRFKEEQRLLKTLQQQAHKLQAKEMTVALNFAVAGTYLSLKGKNVAVSSPLLAALVAKRASRGQSPDLICLGRDNRWYVAAVSDVVALHADVPRCQQVDRLQLPADMPVKPGQCRSGTEDTAEIARYMPQLPSQMLAPEVEQQLERVAQVQALLEAHPIHALRDRATVLKRIARRTQLTTEIETERKRLDKLQSRHWEEFLDLIAVLQEFDALTGDLQATELGKAAAAIRGENELWLGLALMSGEFNQLDPHHFAAACAALALENTRPDSWTSYETSVEVERALDRLRSLRHRLFQQQRRHRVALPIWLEYDLIALVENWALGTEWEQLLENTSLDEGDVVRILRRTLDLLSQVPHLPYAAEQLKKNAYRASLSIDRFPVKEVMD